MKVRMILVPTVICAICGAVLYLVHGMANPKIEAHKLKARLIEAVFPIAKEYRIEDKDTILWVAYDTTGNIAGRARFKVLIRDTVWAVFDTADNKVGLVFKVSPKGYAGRIETLVGLDMDSTITGIRTATPAEGLKETPGIGTKINEAQFKHQFIGKKENAVRLKREGGTIDAITGCTVSSKAVVDGVRKGIEKYKKYLSK